MKKLIVMIGILTICFSLIQVSAFAKPKPEEGYDIPLEIDRAVVDNEYIYIYGNNFGENPKVVLNNVYLDVNQYNNTNMYIEASLGAVMLPATYRLIVSNDGNFQHPNLTDILDVTIGTQGAEGPQGEQGVQGIQGIQGEKGDKGDIGPVGATGPIGDTGPAGAKGEQGTQGEQGLPGVSPNQECALDEYMTGIDATGNIMCRRDFKYVFVSSATYTGKLGGLVGADANCQVLAEAAGLPGQYMAWLSLGTESPSTRFTKPTFKSYLLTDKRRYKVANNWSDLIDKNIIYPINIDENGVMVVGGEVWVWTNTQYDGTTAITDINELTCYGWNDENQQLMTGMRIGNGSNSNELWTDNANQIKSCSDQFHLYCFEQ